MRQSVFVLGMFILVFSGANAQKIVSNEAISKQLTEYRNLCKKYAASKPDSCVICGDLSVKLASKSGDNRQKAFAYNTLGMAKLYNRDLETARIFYDTAVHFGTKSSDFVQLGTAQNGVGTIFQMQAKYDSALIEFDKAVLNFEKTNDLEGLARAHDNAGIVLFMRGLLNESVKRFELAKTFFEKTGNTSSLAAVYYKIASVYIETQNFTDAKTFALKSYDLLKDTDKFAEIVRSLNILGMVSKKLKNYDEAIDFYSKALIISEKYPVPEIIMAIYGNIGTTHYELNEYEKAKQFHKKALELATKHNALSVIASSNSNLGDIERKTGNFHQAELHYAQSVEVYRKTNEVHKLMLVYNKQYLNFKAQNNYQEALYFHEKYIEIEDSLSNEARVFALDSMLSAFKTKELEAEKKHLQNESELRQKTIFNQKIILFAISLIALLTVILTLVLIKKRKYLSAANNLMFHKNEELQKKAEELKVLNDRLSDAESFRKGVTQMIAHDLKNPLHNLLNINFFNTEAERLSVVKYNAKQMLNLVSDLLDVSKSEVAKLEIAPEPVSAHGAIREALENIRVLTDEKKIATKIAVSEKLMLHSDKDMTLRIFTNIFTNAVKFSPANSEIHIETIKTDTEDLAEFKITDFGVGIPEEQSERIFDKFVHANPQKGAVRATGLGLSFCKIAVEAHGGTISAKHEQGKGGVIVFTLPKTVTTNNLAAPFREEFKKITLTESEKSFLKPLCQTLRNIPIYKISTIHEQLALHKNTNKTENIEHWCDAVYKAAVAGNKAEFDSLIIEIQ